MHGGNVVMSNSFKNDMYMPVPGKKNLMVNVAALVSLQPLIRDTFQLITVGPWLNCPHIGLYQHSFISRGNVLHIWIWIYLKIFKLLIQYLHHLPLHIFPSRGLFFSNTLVQCVQNYTCNAIATKQQLSNQWASTIVAIELCHENRMNTAYPSVWCCVRGKIAVNVSCIYHVSKLASRSMYVIRITDDKDNVRQFIMYRHSRVVENPDQQMIS